MEGLNIVDSSEKIDDIRHDAKHLTNTISSMYIKLRVQNDVQIDTKIIDEIIDIQEELVGINTELAKAQEFYKKFLTETQLAKSQAELNIESVRCSVQ